jgi:hypothetical protein
VLRLLELWLMKSQVLEPLLPELFEQPLLELMLPSGRIEKYLIKQATRRSTSLLTH